MNHVRTLLLWLLLAALPLQGYAAARAFMPMGGAATPAMVAGQTAIHATSRHRHAAAVAQPTASDHCAMQVKADHGQCGTESAKLRCGHCASCCVGAAIAVPAPALALAGVWPVGSEAIPYRVMHVTAHIPGGLERPPHTALA